jgi:hypothetical protein
MVITAILTQRMLNLRGLIPKQTGRPLFYRSDTNVFKSTAMQFVLCQGTSGWAEDRFRAPVDPAVLPF